MIRVIVADEAVVRKGLKTILAAQADLNLVAEGDRVQACELAQGHQPDVLLLKLSEGSDLEIVRDIRNASPETQILVSIPEEDALLDTLAAGAAGCFLEDSSLELILLTIRSLQFGGILLDKRLMSRLTRGLRRVEGSPPSNLSERELAVLRLISQGSSNRSIGEKLHLAEATVKKYVHSLKSKLSVSDRAEAAVVGLRLGLLE